MNAMLLSNYYEVSVRNHRVAQVLEETVAPINRTKIAEVRSEVRSASLDAARLSSTNIENSRILENSGPDKAAAAFVEEAESSLEAPHKPTSQSGKKDRPSAKSKAKTTVSKDEIPSISPNPAALSEDASFSACLLIRDDNEILSEWIAYHYFSLKLRNLIVAVDPFSVESPSEILQRWSNSTDLRVREWHDEDYMPAKFLETGRAPDEYQQAKNATLIIDHSEQAMLEVSNHRYRQRIFLSQCMKQFRDEGNTWVIHIDTDEYVVASKLLRQMNPSYVSLPAMDQPGSILTFVQSVAAVTPHLVRYPCISMLRVLFGSVENDEKTDEEHILPDRFVRKSFETLRWKYHALPHDMKTNGNPKVIVDVSVIPDEYFPSDIVYSIHRPVREYCEKNSELSFTSFRKQPIAVNHYLGSWERYSGRKEDKRRSREVYDTKAKVSRGLDDTTLPWFSGFVREYGEDRVAYLLGGKYLAASA